MTLIEVLVVVSIIGILIALLVPAVQMAREAARRSQCSSNLRQIGISLNAYVSAYSVLPAGQGGRGQSIHVAILPYLEQAALYNSINFWDPTDTIGPNATAASTRLSTYVCPSDPMTVRIARSTSYAGNTGNGVYRTTFNGLFIAIGTPKRWLSPAHITDGLSNTAAFSEWLIWASGAVDRRREFYRVSRSGDPSRLDHVSPECEAASERIEPAIMARAKGGLWLSGVWNDTVYDHLLRINGPNCMLPGDSDLMGGSTAGSMHPGGANVLMADGHMRFMKDSTNLRVWRAVGTRNGGETTSDIY